MDATRCISYLTIEHRGSIPEELRPEMGNWVFGCDVCQEVCPWNRVRPTDLHEEFAPERGSGASLDLVELLGLDDADFRARFRRTPLTRTKRRGLLRNAAVALGNLQDPAALPALQAALRDPEPQVRSHAAWAISRYSDLPPDVRIALKTAWDTEQEKDVRDELEKAWIVVGGLPES
jgi:epoxyqueuosine reductase